MLGGSGGFDSVINSVSTNTQRVYGTDESLSQLLRICYI